MLRRKRNSKQTFLVILRGPRKPTVVKSLKASLRKAARASGFSIKEFTVLKYKRVSWKPKQCHYDHLLVTSARAVHFLPKTLKATHVIAIGAQTAKALKERFKAAAFWSRLTVLQQSDQKGVLRLVKTLRGTLLYPHSSLAEPWLQCGLRGKRGSPLLVEEGIHYETSLVAIQSRLRDYIDQRRRLSRHGRLKLSSRHRGYSLPSRRSSLDRHDDTTSLSRNFIFVVTSPSAFKALVSSVSVRRLTSLRARFVTLGATTAAVVRQAGLKPSIARKADLVVAVEDEVRKVF